MAGASIGCSLRNINRNFLGKLFGKRFSQNPFKNFWRRAVVRVAATRAEAFVALILEDGFAVVQ